MKFDQVVSLSLAATAIVVSVIALVVSSRWARRQNTVSKLANSVPVLVDLFREHRQKRLRDAGRFIFNDLDKFDLSKGLDGLPDRERDMVLDLAFYYDNLGALIIYDVVSPEPVISYLGGSARLIYTKLKPIIDVEREKRRNLELPDADRWQSYFRNLVLIAEDFDFNKSRARSRLWKLDSREPVPLTLRDAASEERSQKVETDRQSKD